MSLRKGWNMLLNRIDLRRQATELRSSPLHYVIGISNICNLRCPLCITGRREQKKAVREMDFELFKSIVDKIAPVAFSVQLYNWGEPLLHSSFEEMLKYCSGKGFRTQISSNLSLKGAEQNLEAMVKWGLGHLIVSCDGLTQQEYARYRRNGELETVLQNVRTLSELKKRHGSNFPRITLQMLKNKHNAQSVAKLRESYASLGADACLVDDMTMIFRDKNDASCSGEWLEPEEIARRKYLDVDVSLHGKLCYFLYDTMVIEQDGSIAPCCFTTDPADDFGSWDDALSINEMYNSEKFVMARSLFADRAAQAPVVCHDCSIMATWRGR